MLLLLVLATAVADDQVVVNTDDAGPGSLRQAITDVHQAGSITFDLTYPATITLTGGELAISKSLTIRGPGASNLVFSGDDNSRVVRVVTGTVTISDLTIAHGRVTGAPARGGGILNSGHLTLQRVTVMANVLGAPHTPAMSMDERVHHLFGRIPDAHVHLYGKGERPGRKIGHVNVLGSDVGVVRERAERAAYWLSHGEWTDGWRAGDDAARQR